MADAGSSVGAGSCSGGYCVQVTYTGTAAPSGGSSGGGGYVSSVPPICWYEPWKDPKAALAYMKDAWNSPHYSGIEWLASYGPVEDFEKAQKNSPDATWYTLNCSIGYSDKKVLDYAGIAAQMNGYALPQVALLVQPGGAPPAPAVDVETLRDAAYNSMDIPEPEIQRNPEVAGSGATLVNLDTMFWAEDYRDTWDITASVGPVSATVVARSDDFVLQSPAGGETCTHDEFTTPYAPGLEEAGGCRFPFTRASIGYPAGFPVQATATWTGNPVPSTPQALPPLTTEGQVDVPVVESQALVDSTS